jgi:hypothetical protein
MLVGSVGLSVALIAFGSDSGSKDLPAGVVAPMHRFQTAVQDADAERERFVEKARTVLIADLRNAQKAALQRDDVDEATRIASLVKAEQNLMKAGENDPASNRPYLGQWHARWRNAPDCDYTFTDDQFTSTGGASSKYSVEDGSVVLKGFWGVNRFSPASRDRLLIEGWPTLDDFASDKPPFNFALATRTRK